MNIIGKTIVFKNDYGYSTTISKKNQDGSYDKMYVSLHFPIGEELENKTMIEIIDGFLSFYKTKDGLTKPKIVVMKFTTDEEQKYIQEERQAIQNEGNYDFDDDLPF